MEHAHKTDSVLPIASVLKKCPFCASRGLMIQVADQEKFGIRCTGCPVWIREVCDTPDAALTAWFKRKGTASAAAGRAGKGKCSWRKRRACRRNFRVARKRKKLKWMRNRVDAIITWLKPHREAEMAEMRAALANSWAELTILEPLIRQYPDLSEILDWLKSRQDRSDSHKCPPCNSVL
jgi:hypothetical protein